MKCALLLAVERDSVEMVKLLLEAGADVNELAKTKFEEGMKVELVLRGDCILQS